MRGTFANVRLRNLLAPGKEGSWTVHLPSGEEMSIFDAAMRYIEEGVPLVVLAGKEYGSGSSRDWAAKGPRLLGVRAVIARELRAHPPLEPRRAWASLPLQFPDGEGVEPLGLDGHETFDVADVAEGARTTTVTAHTDDGAQVQFEATVRIDTPQEWLYYRHGGILQYVLRQLLRAATAR